MAATIKDHEEDTAKRKHLKAVLVNKLEGCSDIVNMAVTIPHEDAVISISDDKSIRLWIKRESGQYWPSICHYMESACSALDYQGTSRRLFVGLGSGTISEFEVTEDFNRLHHKRNYLAHMNRITSIVFSLENEWLLSVGRDKYLQWHDCTTGKRLGGYQTEAWCTSLQFDADSKHVFVGDYGGHISVIKLENNSPSLVTTLNGHSGNVRALAWDPEKRLLFSGSFDESIIIWDIGGQQGTAFELHGHFGNAECEWQFFQNSYDSYPGSGYRHQFSSEETAARQSPSLASMEASQSPSLASIPSVESSNSGGNNNTNDSKGKKKVKYETWSQAEQKLLVQLWAENHELLESREARTAWRKISQELHSRLESNKTVEKCMKKMKYLIEKYKEAKEWNRKQTGGTRRQSIFYNVIDAILGCRDIVTLRNVSQAGTSKTSSPLNTSHSSSADSPAGSDDLDAQPDKNELKNEQSQGDPKKKDARDARTDRKKQSKQLRKRSQAAVEEGEEEERRELRESMEAFKKCGENLSNFMETFSETQKQQTAMMGQFIGAMTQFMSKNTESFPPK
ncbi:uncharacterized protein [Montipora foliosa]|uniref:uncharacterized protein isoform X2 n=1 Tax=Montipora foliosa TaxID=591990 RepID=UPI0035F0FB0A